MATIPIRDEAFWHILKAASVSIGDTEEAISTLAETPSGIRLLETRYSSEKPTVKAQVSRRIERGSVGRYVKKKRRGRCQICEALGNSPVAFMNLKGQPYSEAHHVIPVSHLIAGSLSHVNIMVLCPNHHRQAHYGKFQVKHDEEKAWVISLDDRDLRIGKTEL
jgi:predicted HNH restriction endonuclease